LTRNDERLDLTCAFADSARLDIPIELLDRIIFDEAIDFVFCRADGDPRPHDPDDLRREVLYPVLDRCGIKRTPRADGFHAFRRAASKYLRKASGLEMAAVQLGHKRMTTTDEHYNDRDMDDLKKAAELVESAFISSFANCPHPTDSIQTHLQPYLLIHAPAR
jgi:integrase